MVIGPDGAVAQCPNAVGIFANDHPTNAGRPMFVPRDHNVAAACAMHYAIWCHSKV